MPARLSTVLTDLSVCPRMNVDQLIRPEVLNLRAYKVADATGLIKLDAMENPYVWPDELVVAWSEILCGAAINRYPDPQAHTLKVALRKYLGLPTSTPLILGNGSDLDREAERFHAHPARDAV